MSTMNTFSFSGKFGVADYTLETSNITVMPLGAGKMIVSVDGIYNQVVSAAIGTITGGSGDDHISSPRVGVSLFGGDGDDVLEATGGRSLLSGGPGQDVLIAGGRGATLIGDASVVIEKPLPDSAFYPDVFVIPRVEASPLSSPVLIMDFDSRGGDRIDLSAIDGDYDSVGHQELRFSQDGAQPHSVWYEAFGYGAASEMGYLRGDVNGDRGEDFLVMVEHRTPDLLGDAISDAWMLGLGVMAEAGFEEQVQIPFPEDGDMEVYLPGLPASEMPPFPGIA